jgi:hypothetical protein
MKIDQVNIAGGAFVLLLVLLVLVVTYNLGYQAGIDEALNILQGEQNDLHKTLDSLSKVTTRITTTGGLLVVTGRLQVQDPQLPPIATETGGVMGVGGSDD